MAGQRDRAVAAAGRGEHRLKAAQRHVKIYRYALWQRKGANPAHGVTREQFGLLRRKEPDLAMEAVLKLPVVIFASPAATTSMQPVPAASRNESVLAMRAGITCAASAASSTVAEETGNSRMRFSIPSGRKAARTLSMDITGLLPPAPGKRRKPRGRRQRGRCRNAADP